MEQHDLIQGSNEWHVHRAAHFNASDAPAMLGLSKYKTRSALLKQYATSIFDEAIDQATQARFDEGHRIEALARQLAEKIIGQRLFPEVGSEGKLSASFDGLTMDESICFEHKSLNDTIRGAIAAGTIPAEYCAQMEQQLMISGATKCLFMASKWDGDELVEELHCWYESDQNMRERIMHGWTQFAIDIENYSEGEYIPAPAKATPTMDLPAVYLSVSGGLRVITNLDLFHEALKHFIGNINMEPNDDQGFADCKDAVKKLKAAEDALDAGEAQALAQITSIDEMRRMKKLVFELSRTTRLQVEKLVKERDGLVKRQIAQEATDAFAEHIAALNKQIGKPYMPQVEAKFAEVMKSKKTFSSMREAVNNELVRVKIEASAIGNMIGINMNSLRTLAADFSFLFSDTASLVLKENEALEAIIKNRISEHKTAEIAKEEDMRQRIQAEEEAKARVKVEAETHQQSSAYHPADPHGGHAGASTPVRTIDTSTKPVDKSAEIVHISKNVRPSDADIIRTIIKEFGCTNGQACDWIMEMADNMKQAA